MLGRVGERAAVRRRDPAGDRQPEAGPAGADVACLGEAHEPVEHPLPVGDGDAGTVVLDREQHRVVLTRDRDADRAHAVGGAGRVVDEVAEDLCEPVRVDLGGHGSVGRADVERHRGEADPRAVDLGACPGDEVDRAPVERDPPVEPGHREHVVDEPRGTVGLSDHVHRELFAHRGVGIPDERVRRRADARDRGAQLVGGVGEEPADALLGGHGLRLGTLDGVEHVVEGHRDPADLGVPARRAEPPTAVALRDGPCGGGELVEGTERAPHDEHDADHGDTEERERGTAHHPAELGEGLLDVPGPRGEGDPGAVVEHRPECQDPVVGRDGRRRHPDAARPRGRRRAVRRVGPPVRGRPRVRGAAAIATRGSGEGRGVRRSGAQLVGRGSGVDGRSVGLHDPDRQSLCGQPVGQVVGVEHADEGRRGRGTVAQSVLDLGAEPGAEDRLDRDDESGEQDGEEHEHGDDGAQPERRGAQAALPRGSSRARGARSARRACSTRGTRDTRDTRDTRGHAAPRSTPSRYPRPLTVCTSRGPCASILRRSALRWTSTRFPATAS